MKQLTANFVNDVLKTKDLVLIQDEVIHNARLLVTEACEKAEKKLFYVHLEQCWPLDLEELFQRETSGVLCIEGIEIAHPYMRGLIYNTLLNRSFKRGHYSNLTEINPEIQFVILSSKKFFIEDRALYRRLYKLVNTYELRKVA